MERPTLPHRTGNAAGSQVELMRGAVNKLLTLGTYYRQGRQAAPDAEQAAEAFAAAVRECQASGNTVAIEVDRKAMHFEGGEVTGGDLLSRALVDGLFEEGLRGIYIQPEVRRAELTALGRLLSTDWKGRGAEDDDLESSFWALGFDNLHLDIVARRLSAEEEAAEGDPVLLLRRAMSQLHLEVGPEEVGQVDRGIAAFVNELKDMYSRVPVPQPPSQGALARQVETVVAQRELEEGRYPALIFELLRNISSPQSFAAAVELVLEHCRRAVELGRAEEAGPVLRKLCLLASGELFLSWPMRTELETALGRLSGPGWRQAWMEGMAVRPDHLAWAPLFFTLGQAAGRGQLGPLLELGMALPIRELRSSLADGAALAVGRLAISGKELLQGASEGQLVMTLMVLRRKPEATLTEQLLARAQSADPEVRAAVLLALRELQSPRVREVVRASLKDPAPAVRLEALRYLSVYRDAESAEPILARLRGAAAEEADESEMRALAIAYAAILREKALPELEKVASTELSSRQPAALRASLHGIRACGGAGRASLERLGRTQPRLREEIRGLLGGTA